MRISQVTARGVSGLLAAWCVAGCSSGSSTPLAPVVTHPSSSPAVRVANAAFTIVIPARSNSATSLRRQFISPSTQGIAVTVTQTVNGSTVYDATTNYDVAAGSSSACSNTTPQTCTLQIPAPVAVSPVVDTFAFTLYDQEPGGTPATFGSSAQVLGTGTTSASIVADTANTITAYVDGRPASIGFAAIVVSGDGYLGFTAPVGVNAYDVDLNLITGGTYDPYAPSISLAVTEPVAPSGSTTLAVVPVDLSSANPPAPVCDAPQSGAKSVSACRTADAITATYRQPSGAQLHGTYYATIGSGISSIVDAIPLFLAPIFVIDTTDSNKPKANKPYFTQGAVGSSPMLTLSGATGTIGLSEPGATKEGTSPSFVVSDNANCAGVIAPGGLQATSRSTYTITGVTPVGSTAAGCVVIFTDNFGGTVALDVVN